ESLLLLVRKDNEFCMQFTWDTVKVKLLDSLAVIRSGIYSNGGVGELKENNMRLPSSLFAISEGARMRLLWASFQQLNKEVTNISAEAAKNSDENGFSSVLNGVV
ncbi:hypothetical protein M569_12040, partial [Genlisea aurea]